MTVLARLLGQQMELAARRDEQLKALVQHLHYGTAAGARSTSCPLPGLNMPSGLIS